MAIKKRAIVYIDGFNLYYGMMASNLGKHRWIDLLSFSQSTLVTGYHLEMIKYFTSHIKGNVNKHNRQMAFLNAIRVYIGHMLEIKYGSYQLFDSECNQCRATPLYCANCGAKYQKPNEKKTDVNIATAILTDCIEDKTDVIVLVSGDSDYTTPLDEIGRLFPNIERVIAFPPRRNNQALYNVCDRYFNITRSAIIDAGLMPDPITNPKTGTNYYMPIEWA